MNQVLLKRIFQRLDKHYGPQHWWPADSPFEVMVGAVLVQHTAWHNVVTAIDNLKRMQLLSAEAILAASPRDLASIIRPAGYFNVKTRRLQSLCSWYLEHGGFDVLLGWPQATLREALLQVHGIGPETADDILLYAFQHPVFVIDAYTRRLFSRLGLVEQDMPYENLRHSVEQVLEHDVAIFNQFHALIVVHAKHICKKTPQCNQCCLVRQCSTGSIT